MRGAWLLVPAKRAAEALASAPAPDGAMVIDLRGASSAEAGQAREAAAAAFETLRGRPRVVVAIHPLDSGLAEDDLSAICRFAPAAILLPRVDGAADVQHLGARLAVEEAAAGLEDGSIGVAALAETGSALFDLIDVARASPRLRAIAWDGEALARDLGAEAAREPDGRWCDPCQTARTLALAACADAKIPAIDGPFTNATDEAFAREAERARRDGFSGKLCLTPKQAASAAGVFSA